MNRLLLNMIVKNEAARIDRCLRSFLPHVVGGVVADTGSSDDTIERMQRAFDGAGKPLEVARCEFVDFAQARNVALRAARASQIPHDYLLFCDADHELVAGGPLRMQLTAPAYSLLQDNGACRYWNVRLLRADETCEYVGVTHECITPSKTPTGVDGWHIRDHEDGSNRAEKYKRDVKLLMTALRDEPDNPRYAFYMVQSLFGAGMVERAREFALMRVRMGGHPEETWWAAYNLALFGTLLPEPVPEDQVRQEYLQAYELRPWRAEPLVDLAQRHRKSNEPQVGLLYARQAALLPYPEREVLPVLHDVYEWAALDEWLVCATKAGNIIEARQAAKRLRKRRLPEDEQQRARIEKNLNALLRKGEK